MFYWKNIHSRNFNKYVLYSGAAPPRILITKSTKSGFLLRQNHKQYREQNQRDANGDI